MKEKSAIFCFLKLKAKEKAKFLQNYLVEGDFSLENLGVFFHVFLNVYLLNFLLKS